MTIARDPATEPADTEADTHADTQVGAAPSPAAPRPQEGVWPGLATPPHAPHRARIAEMLFRRAVRDLPVRVVFPGGERIGAGGDRAPVMRVVRPAAFFHRLGRSSKIGFGEAYMVGDWTTTALPELLTPFAARLSTLISPALQRFGRRFAEARRPHTERNTVQGSRENIRRHYDLSNEMFELFLDPSMTYSCAIFEPGDTLEQAQTRKYEAICRMLDLGPDDHLLEIGTGWGQMATHAALTRGCRVTSATVSENQRRWALRRIEEAGVADRVQVVLCDYRQLDGCYDKLATIEMLEAVGEEYWPTFFGVCDRLLRPGGRAAVQTITMPHRRYRATRRSYGWIHKYVFPGGLIPSPEAIDAAVRARSMLQVQESVEIGSHYVPTLRAWRERFLANAEHVRALGFSGEFVRMWEFYLAYCEAGFATRALGNVQLLLARAGER
jgi:cyclopropane-fatty-acyl-phospholipid synthase